ncbi:MAG: hypothetical protein KDC98_26730 [Planctomycetes bacterium]|nr:hypothetical protein [Planctomycetota bacterium]
MHRPFLVCLLSVATVELPSQTVHTVGPGSLPQIRDALAIAAPGDIVLVQPGTYAHFDAAVGVTIRAVTPGTVDVDFDRAFLPPGCATSPPCILTAGATTITLPPGQSMQLIGLRFAGSSTLVYTTTVNHRLEITGGAVQFDDCVVEATGRSPVTATGTALHFQDTTLRSLSAMTASSALVALGCQVTAASSEFVGGSTTLGSPGSGIALFASSLNGSGLSLHGGGVLVGSLGAPALTADATSAVWLSDSTLMGGNTMCPMSVRAGTVGHLDRCTLGPVTSGCTQLPSGFLPGVERVRPPALAMSFDLVFHVQPNGFVALMASFELASSQLPALTQPWLSPAGGGIGLGLLFANALGTAATGFAIPNDPNLLHRQIWVHSASGSGLPLQVAPTVGGVIR